MPVPSTAGCPDPFGHTAHIANHAYIDLDKLADRLAYLGAHDVAYARHVADDLAAQLRTLVNRLEAKPPCLSGYHACTDPDLGDGYYAQQQRAARREQHLSGSVESPSEHDLERGHLKATTDTPDPGDDPIGFALTDAAARLLDAHHAAPHLTSRAADPQLHLHTVSGRSGRGRPIR